jgi:hypothetical protein
MTVHSLPPVEPEQVKAQKRRGRTTMLLVMLACLAPVLVSYLMFYVVRPSERNNYAELIQPTRSMPADLPLHTLDGQPITAKSLHGQWLMVVVGGADCDKRCETLLFAQRQLREMMGREKERIDRVWLIDDDAAVRAPILTAMQTGTPTALLRVPAAALKAWLAADAGHDLADHLYLVDPMGEWMMRTPVPLDPVKFRKDLDRLLRASASWDRDGRGP